MPRTGGSETGRVGSARTWRDRSGFCGMDLLDQPSGVLTPAERVTLKDVTERTRMAHDLLAAFADRYDAFPAQLVSTHTREMAALRVLLGRYGMDDPTTGLGAGAFAEPARQAEYDRLLAYGSTGRAAALEVGAELAGRVIAVVERALPALDAPDVRHTYLHVVMTAQQQIRLTQAWSGR